jgi:hypothetical protein
MRRLRFELARSSPVRLLSAPMATMGTLLTPAPLTDTMALVIFQAGSLSAPVRGTTAFMAAVGTVAPASLAGPVGAVLVRAGSPADSAAIPDSMAELDFTAAADSTVERDSTAGADVNRSIVVRFAKTADAPGCQPFFFSGDYFVRTRDTTPTSIGPTISMK